MANPALAHSCFMLKTTSFWLNTKSKIQNLIHFSFSHSHHFLPKPLSLSVGMTSVYGTLLWTLWLLFVKHFCVTCYICLTCIIVCGTFCLLSIFLWFFFLSCIYLYYFFCYTCKFYISLTLIVILLRGY